MYRIDTPSATPALPAPSAPGVAPDSYWTGGNPATGELATIVAAEFWNMVQEEIANAVDNQGALAPLLNKSLRNQLLTAIRREVAAAAGGGSGTAPPLPALDYHTVSQPHTSPISAPSMAITTACSFVLPAGNWDLWGTVGFSVNTTNQFILWELGTCIGVGDNQDWINGDTGLSTQMAYNVPVYPTTLIEMYAGHAVINLAASTTIYLLGRPHFDPGATVGVYGFMAAQRL